MRRIIAVLPRLVSGRAGRFARTEMFQLAVDVAAADLWSRGEATEIVDRLRSVVPMGNAPGAPQALPRERSHAHAAPRQRRPRPLDDAGRGRR
jgi:poly(A) polymerase